MQDATASIEEDIDWIVYLLNNIVFMETCIISYKKPIASPGSIQDAWGWCTGMTPLHFKTKTVTVFIDPNTT